MSKVILDTQIVNINSEKRIAVTTIEKPFMSAGKKLGWRWQPQGVGLNLKLIQLLLSTKFTLVLYIEYYNATYYMRHDVLFEYLRDNECDYKIKDTILKVIPIELFTTYEVHHE